MVPRNEIVGIDINDDWKSIVRQLTHSPHGRIVLYRDSLDDAISMLRVREAYRLMTEKKEFTKEIMLRAADEIYFVPEGTPLSTQLVKFQRNKRKSVWWSMNTAIFRGWSPSKIFLKRLSATSPPPCHPPSAGGSDPA